MNYFGIKTVAVGLFSFFCFGALNALFVEAMSVFLSFLLCLLSLPRRLFKNRSRFFYTKGAFRKKEIKRGCARDFLSVTSAFLGYMLISYAIFDGVFRFIFLLVVWLGYIFADRLLVKRVTGLLLKATDFVLGVLERILSVPVFLLFKLYRALKPFVLSILRVARQALLKSAQPLISKRELRKMSSDFVDILKYI